MQFDQLIDARRRVYALVDWAFFGPVNGLLIYLHQAFPWTNDDLLLIGITWTHFSKIAIKMNIFNRKKIHLEISSGGRSFCSCLNGHYLYLVLAHHGIFLLSISWPHHTSHIKHQLISPWCRIYASVNLVSIVSHNGLSPIRRQAII